MSITGLIKKIIRKGVELFYPHFFFIHAFRKETKYFLYRMKRYNASMNTNKDIQKMQYTLLRENHVIEKGMSMRNPRKGFGQQKVLALIDRLDLYFTRYGNKGFLDYPMSTIKTYIHYTKDINRIDIPEIESKFKQLCDKVGNCNLSIHSGVKELNKDDIYQKINLDFEGFVKARHSIRYFSSENPDINLINKALDIAQYTPSACNRQGWKNYVFTGSKTIDLVRWQGGANGFEEDIPLAILVTTNLKAFLYYEPYQSYVDGGMYAMSLLYSLHAMGFGTIPLSTGFGSDKIKRLHRQFNIPESEVPIVIIGVGCLLDKLKVAVSTRKNHSETTHYI